MPNDLISKSCYIPETYPMLYLLDHLTAKPLIELVCLDDDFIRVPVIRVALSILLVVTIVLGLSFCFEVVDNASLTVT